MTPIAYAVIGIGGYGARHLSAALRLQEEGLLRLQAVADPFTDQNRDSLRDLANHNVKHYTDWREMLERESGLEAVSIPAPIPLHVPMALACFERKLNVVLEKPPAVLIQDVDRLIECAAKNGVVCQVGFQNMMEPAAHELKERLLGGEIGDPVSVTAFGAWRRLDSYYSRAGWAGKLRLDDTWVLDGPLNNPLCHYVHQALFFAGSRPGTFAVPRSVRAELYRAHPIEAEDIVCSRAELDVKTSLHCYLTTCAPVQNAPEIRIKGSSGTARWTPGHYEINGRSGKSGGDSSPQDAVDVIRNFIRALGSEEKLLSPLDSTRGVILHNNACYKSSGKIHRLPEKSIRRCRVDKEAEMPDTATEAPGLTEAMQEAAEKTSLFSELEIAWAKETSSIRCDFSHFDPGFLCT